MGLSSGDGGASLRWPGHGIVWSGEYLLSLGGEAAPKKARSGSGRVALLDKEGWERSFLWERNGPGAW